MIHVNIYLKVLYFDKNLSCVLHKDRIGFMKQNVTQNVINSDMGNIYASWSVRVLLTVTPLLYWLPG